MRLKKMLPLLLAALLVFTACASRSEPITSIEDLPPVEEISKLSVNEIYQIKADLDDISVFWSCNAHFRDVIEEFLQGEEEGFFRLRGVGVVRDDLAVIPGKNNKALMNVELSIEVEMDTTKYIDNCDRSYELFTRIWEYLDQTDTFYRLKVKRCTISTYDRDGSGYLVKTAEMHRSVTNDSVFREQPEDEYAAQTVAFTFSQENPEFRLDRFGAIAETKELCVEYHVEDSYFGRGVEVNNQAIDNLENIGEDVKDYLLKEEAVNRYMAGNGLEILTVTFRNGILDDFYLTFNYQL